MAIQKSKTVYVYDEDGYFSDTQIAQFNPRSSGWLYPPKSTTVKPALQTDMFYKIKSAGDLESGWDAEPYPTKATDFIGVEISHQSRTSHSQVLRELLRDFVKQDSENYREKQINDENGNLLAITVEKIPELTAEELKEQKANEARAKRDSLISQSDYLLQPDYPIEADLLAEVKVYRQELRDVPQQPEFPENISWPEVPKIISQK